jgi:DNA repair protein SbcC/Rad50
MHIHYVEFKNCMSYGNQMQRIDFQGDTKLYLLSGFNGSGKSVLALVIKFLLFGKVDGVNLNELANRINKNMYGKIAITCKGKLLEIERGLSPNIFKVFINGIEYDQAGKLNTQEYLEEELYEISYNVFKNMFVISINDFKSFLTMTPGDKKNIVDKLFGFSIINEMSEYVKRDKRRVEDSLNILNEDIRNINDNIESINKKIENISLKEKEINTEKVKEIKEKLVVLDENKNKLNEAKVTFTKKLNELNLVWNELNKKKSTKKNELNNVNEKIDLFNKNKCPHCETEFVGKVFDAKRSEFNELKERIPLELDVIEKDIKEIDKSIKECSDKNYQIVSKISSFEANIATYKTELINLVKNKNNVHMEELQSLVTENSEKMKSKAEDKNSAVEEKLYMDILEKVLGDNGIKNMAMQTILPALNMEIVKLIKSIHLPFNIKFDNKFDCKVMSLGEEINPKTMSTGEKKRADFIIIIALIKIIKLRYPSLNLLFLDEIFSSVDLVGIHDIIAILKNSIKEIGLNAFVIHHAPLQEALFDKKMVVTKNNGFSSIEETIID